MEHSFNIAHEAAGTVFRARAEEKVKYALRPLSTKNQDILQVSHLYLFSKGIPPILL